MLTRQQTAQPVEKNWFMFSAGLMHVLCSDYIALRMLGQLEPWTTAMTGASKMLDVVEKSLKLDVSVQRQSEAALTEAIRYGHNIERLRSECARFPRPRFAWELHLTALGKGKVLQRATPLASRPLRAACNPREASRYRGGGIGRIASGCTL